MLYNTYNICIGTYNITIIEGKVEGRGPGRPRRSFIDQNKENADHDIWILLPSSHYPVQGGESTSRGPPYLKITPPTRAMLLNVEF